MQRHYPINPQTGLEDPSLVWTQGNPASGTEGSYPPYQVVTNPQDEILNVITCPEANLTPTDTDPAQLYEAIKLIINALLPDEGTAYGAIEGVKLSAGGIFSSDIPGLSLFATLADGDAFEYFSVAQNKHVKLTKAQLRAALFPDSSIWHVGTPFGGTAIALTTTVTPTLSADASGIVIAVPVNKTSGAAPTLDFGYGAKPILLNDGTVPVGAEMKTGVGQIAEFYYDGTSARLMNPLQTSARSNPQFLHIEARRAQGVGANGMDGYWRAWPLNTVVSNTITSANFDYSQNQVILPPGTYRVNYCGAAHDAGQHRCRLENSTNSTVLGYGTTGDSHCEFGGGPTTNTSVGMTRFTLTGTSRIQLTHQNTDAGNSKFGDDSNNSTNLDAFIRIEREIGS